MRKNNEELLTLFNNFYNNYKDYKVLFVGHRRADPDAVASASAISSIFPNSSIAFPDLLPNAQALLDKIGKDYYILDSLNLERFELIVSVDTCSSKMVSVDSVIACIDHHHKDKNSFKPSFDITSQDYPSAAELVYDLIKDKTTINRNVAFALAVGIAADTYRFKAADLISMKKFVELLELSGEDVEEVYKYSSISYKPDEKMALLSAFKNINYMYSSGLVISYTETKRYASEVASMLANISDMSFALERFNNGYKMSARSNSDCKIPLNILMAKLGDRLNGYGGGHHHAAGAFVVGSIDEIMNNILSIIRELKD